MTAPTELAPEAASSAASPTPSSREIRDLPAPGGWPLIGNLLQFDTRSAHAQVEAWARRYGGMFSFRAGRRQLVVVTDHVMPGMTGAELALRLRVEHPETAVLIISGYQGIDLIAPDVVRLSKPFRQIHLVASIAAAREQVMA